MPKAGVRAQDIWIDRTARGTAPGGISYFRLIDLAKSRGSGAVGAVAAAGRRCGGIDECLVHDAPDGARAAPALRAAAEAMVHLSRGARRGFACRQRRPHVVVGEDVAGADDHGRERPAKELVRPETISSIAEKF